MTIHKEGPNARTEPPRKDAPRGHFRAQGQEGQHEKREIPLESLYARDPNVKPPTLPDSALYGVAGEIVRKTAPHTEAHPAAIYFQLLTVFANVFGRSAHILVDRDKHFTNEFVIIVGRTASGRKGTSYGHAQYFGERVEQGWTDACVRKSITSGEGLVREMADGTNRDRRCLLFFAEFSTVLNAAKWTGSTITGVIREAWDTGTLHNTAIRNRPKGSSSFLKATDCHISITGHITQEELITMMPEHSEANGFANRFLHVYAERSGCHPEGDQLHQINFDQEVARIRSAVVQARQRGKVTKTPAASALWRALYPSLTREIPSRIGKFLSRGAPHVLRLALILTLLDGATQVDVRQLRAAYELWEYCEKTTMWAYSAMRYTRTAQYILGTLVHEGPQTLRDINKNVLKGNHTAMEIGLALEEIAPLITASQVRRGDAKRWTTVIALKSSVNP
jgi:Protein of unknown function (DUF3987)